MVFIELEPSKTDDDALRPFHHCWIVVTSPGQHPHGGELTSSSRGCSYDWYGSKEQPKDAEVIKNKYNGLPRGHWSTYSGCTDKSFAEIQGMSKCTPSSCAAWVTSLKLTTSMTVGSEIKRTGENGEYYALLGNGCRAFAIKMTG
ncbi:hypothetical protein VUR80DRAFT_1775 [Thermomyces stellatus]